MLIKGADWFVDGTSGAAVSINAALKGNADIAIDTIIAIATRVLL